MVLRPSWWSWCHLAPALQYEGKLPIQKVYIILNFNLICVSNSALLNANSMSEEVPHADTSGKPKMKEMPHLCNSLKDAISIPEVGCVTCSVFTK